MKQILFLLIAVFLYTSVAGQQFSVSGKVINQTKAPVGFAYAGLLKPDSTPVAQTMTDTLGNFTLKAPKGVYRLIVRQFGNTGLDRQMVLDKAVDLGVIEIRELTELQGVTIAAAKRLVEQKVDRLVFNVEKAVMPTGGTALDALKATPGVRVQQESVSVVGKGEVLVMVDDRLQRMSQEDLTVFLKSIPADNIKSIEVITAPPAKYEAEGNSGLINIKLKKAKANSWDATIGAGYTQKTYGGGNVQGLFNYNHGKVALQASLSKSRQQLMTTSDDQIFYPKEWWKQEIRNKSESNALSAGLGLDYKVTPKWTTGIKYLGSFTDKTSANQPLTTRFNSHTQAVNGYVASAVDARNKPAMNALNWYHAFTLDSLGKNLTVDIDFFNYRKTDARNFSGNELDPMKGMLPGTFFSSANSNVNKVNNFSGKADVLLPYKWANISFGGKFSYTNTNNDLVVYDRHTGTPVLNTDQSNVFSYKEYNEALYFSANKKLNTQWEVQAGLRAEATQTKGYSKNLDQTNANRYIKLFPTAYVTYVPDDKNSLSLNYSRRIRRPDFDYLNPFVVRTSPYFYSEGNPFLKPSYIDNIELSYVKNQKWASSVYYSRVKDFGQDLSIVDSVTNITRQTPVNYGNTYQVGFSTYYNFNLLSWWSSFTGFNVNYQHVKSKTGFVSSTDGYNAYCYTNNDFTLNKSKTLFFSANYALQLPGRYQIFHIGTLHMLDVSMKFLMANKKLSLTVAGEDLLNAQRPLITYYSNGIKNTVRSYGDTRGFRISLSYKMGNNQIKVKQRDFGNEDERSRTK
ncbi:Outer membrane receptor proteins, mostly Fe transport [Chitinophaga eiseniae]|uniref:Outer membrane receptor proteins, mostly Fe transport n=1 Tax=Chitinophaga eiseniae TaxID=634771 RepID=A0A1T4TB32_9BACT|nr:TonB-dependent receptor [Chitinophaga eiseniae]SKA37541.1 Outer membrane receptor proteins, mostly Fe transport [Chitinophaga eiseniae]